MGTLTIIFLVLPALCFSDLVDQLPGVWTAVAGYPSQSDNIVLGCARRTIEHNNIMRSCTSEDSQLNLPVFDVIALPCRFTGDNIQGTVTMGKYSTVFKEVNSQNAIFSAPNRCVASPYDVGYIRLIDDNYFVQYVKNTTLSISAKIVPSETELRKILDADEELRNKDLQIYCHERLAINNTDLVQMTNTGAEGIRRTKKLLGDNDFLKIEIFEN